MILDFRKSFPGRFTVEARFRMRLEQSTALILFGPSEDPERRRFFVPWPARSPEVGSIRFISEPGSIPRREFGSRLRIGMSDIWRRIMRSFLPILSPATSDMVSQSCLLKRGNGVLRR